MSTSPKRILIVDDETRLLEFLSDSLKRLSDAYTVETASSGADAVEAVRRSRPDLVLLDISLPDLNGLEVLKLIRGIARGTRVIMITGTQDPKAAASAMEGGAFAYIPKPFNVTYIENLVAAALEGRR